MLLQIHHRHSQYKRKWRPTHGTVPHAATVSVRATRTFSSFHGCNQPTGGVPDLKHHGRGRVPRFDLRHAGTAATCTIASVGPQTAVAAEGQHARATHIDVRRQQGPTRVARYRDWDASGVRVRDGKVGGGRRTRCGTGCTWWTDRDTPTEDRGEVSVG